MVNKKLVSLLITGILVTAVGSISAFAAAPAPSVPYCTVSDCTLTGDHYHNGTAYAAHTADDGHTYHYDCGVSGCTVTGSHTHHSSGSRYGSHHSGGHHR